MITMGSKTICSKSNSITFYRSLGMRNEVKTQKERSQGTSIQQTSMPYLPRGKGEGGAVITMGSKTICSKSNSITFYRSLGMRDEVKTQKEPSQGTSIQQTSMPYLPRGKGEGGGGCDNDGFQDYLLQIQFYHVL